MTPERADRLTVIPCDLDEANLFIERHHRHHGKVPGAKLAIAVADSAGTVRGIAVLSRPVSRMLQDGWTIEVTRVATDGCPNACSALYGAARRIGFAMGYRRIVTYTLPEEGGASLRGAGWRCLGERGGGSWDRPSRPRIDKHPTQSKIRWDAVQENR